MKRFSLITFILLLISGILLPATKNGKHGNSSPSSSSRILAPAIQQYLQGDDFRLWLSNHSAVGYAAWGTSGPPHGSCGQGIGLDFPVGWCIEHLYGAGPAIGGIINGVARVSQGYNTDNGLSEFYPGTAADTFQILGRGVSDNDASVSYTDAYASPITPGHVPMGVRIIQKSYAWNAGRVGQILPLEFTLMNIGAHVIDSVYLGFFVDPDVGPVSSPSFAMHNYSAYLPNLRTAYAANPIDFGSTPVGVTVLSVPGNLDSLRYVWQWYGFNIPGTSDSVLYAWMAGKPFGAQLIDSNQSPALVTDTHFMLSFGPLGTMKPGDSLSFAVAIVGGQSLLSGANNLEENAVNALVLHNRAYLLPPVLPQPRLESAFDSTGPILHLHWGSSGVDPLSVWDDSNHLAASFPGSSWRRSQPPPGHFSGGRIFGGYRLYRASNSSPLQLVGEFDTQGDSASTVTVDTAYVDSTLGANQKYYYKLTAFSIPDWTVIQAPIPGGGVSNDTLEGLSMESPAAYDTVEFVVIGVNEKDHGLPTSFQLQQNYPNPFNPVTTIRYALPGRSVVTLKVYNVLGEEVSVMRDAESMEAGYYADAFDVSRLASGVYFYRLHAVSLTDPLKSFDRILKMVALK